jgi:hypothetical protein
VEKKSMRFSFLIPLVLLAACATTPGDYPMPRYADAASRGTISQVFAGRPSPDQVAFATDKWSLALADSFSCGVPPRQIIDAGLVGALEVGAMNAAASDGSEREVRRAANTFVSQFVGLAVRTRERPPASRCDALAAWAPRTADAGREAVSRARSRGVLSPEYGLLFDLLGVLTR